MLNIKMKSITEYIQESFNDINNEVKIICDLLMSGINYGEFKEVKEILLNSSINIMNKF